MPPPAPTCRRPRSRPSHVVPAVALACCLLSVAGAAEQDAGPPEPVALAVTTSDGVTISSWYYEAPGEEPALATVILLHDLGGSHKTLEPLAKALQAGGCSVVAPDLRGHGGSSISRLEKAAGTGKQANLLKSSDFVAMTATAGGRLREQSAVRGDVESLRNWIKQKSDNGKLGLDRLYLVGSGLGAAIAAGWTAADAAWPPIASGKQGGDVRGLVLIDPSFVTKGFSIGRSLGNPPLKNDLPIMLIAGGEDRDVTRVFDPLKRSRPESWFDSRAYDAEKRLNTSPAKDSEASLVFLKLGGRLTGDALASARSTGPRKPDPAGLILAFIKATNQQTP